MQDFSNLNFSSFIVLFSEKKNKLATTDQVPSIISPSSTSQMLRNVSSSDFQGLDHHRINFNFMRKIPPGAEASNILVGEVDFLTKTLSAFIRLNQATVMGDLTEVPVPTRFLFYFNLIFVQYSSNFYWFPLKVYFCFAWTSRQSDNIPRNRTLNGNTYVR